MPDGSVDQLDYRYWKANYGLSFAAGGASVASASVPEPGARGLLIVAALIAQLGAARFREDAHAQE
jgi:hypothetical protein